MARYELKDFTGGINDSIDPSSIAENEVSSAKNMRLDLAGLVRSRKGTTVVVSSGFSDVVTSGFEGTLASGTVRNLMTSSNGFFYESGSTANALGTTGVTANSGAYFRWVMFNDTFIGVNRAGTRPVKWDGNTGNNVELLDTQYATTGLAAPIDVAVWNRRVVMCQGTDLFVSEPNLAESWFDGDSAVLRFRGSKYGEEAITALGTFQGNLYVFKKNSIWEINPGAGDTSSWTVKLIHSTLGTEAPYSIVDIPGLDLLFANRQGIYSMVDIKNSGEKSVTNSLVKSIDRTIWSFLTLGDIEKFTAVYDEENERYLLSNPSDASLIEINIKYSVQNQKPSVWYHTYPWSFSYLWRRPSKERTSIYGGTDTNKTYRLETTNLDDASTEYDQLLVTRRETVGDFTDNKFFRRIDHKVLQSKSFNIVVTYLFDQGRRTKQQTINPFTGNAFWDTGIWDTATWTDPEIADKQLYLGIRSRDVQIKYSVTNSNADFRLSKTMLDFDSGAEDNQQNLNG